MTLHTTPRAPSPSLFIRLAAPKIPQSWAQYLGEAAAA
jgi:hypothetical protein